MKWVKSDIKEWVVYMPIDDYMQSLIGIYSTPEEAEIVAKRNSYKNRTCVVKQEYKYIEVEE